MSAQVKERCIDGKPHKFVYRDSRRSEIRWHVWAIIDVYFCEKCLKYETTEREVPQETRY